MAEFWCEKCGNNRTQIRNSRPDGGSRIKRTRYCRCGHSFGTFEISADEYAMFDRHALADIAKELARGKASVERLIERGGVGE